MDSVADSVELEPVEMSCATMKSIGVQWLVRLFEYLSATPSIIVNGYLAADISQSINAGKPTFEDGLSIELSSDNEEIATESDEELGSDAVDSTELSTGASNDIVCIDTDN